MTVPRNKMALAAMGALMIWALPAAATPMAPSARPSAATGDVSDATVQQAHYYGYRRYGGWNRGYGYGYGGPTIGLGFGPRWYGGYTRRHGRYRGW